MSAHPYGACLACGERTDEIRRIAALAVRAERNGKRPNLSRVPEIKAQIQDCLENGHLNGWRDRLAG